MFQIGDRVDIDFSSSREGDIKIKGTILGMSLNARKEPQYYVIGDDGKHRYFYKNIDTKRFVIKPCFGSQILILRII